MMWLGLLALLSVAVVIQLAVLGGMIPRRVVARAQVRLPRSARDALPTAERAAAEIAAEARGAATPPQITVRAVDGEDGTQLVFTVEGDVPGRFARLQAHFRTFPRMARRSAALAELRAQRGQTSV